MSFARIEGKVVIVGGFDPGPLSIRSTLDEINQAFEVDNDKEKTHAVFVAISI